MPLLPNTAFDADLTLDRLERPPQRCSSSSTTSCRQPKSTAAVDQLRPDPAARLRPAHVVRAARRASTSSKEDPRLLDRYGRTLFGHSTLIARRLVEAGVRFVNVTWDLFWDRIQIDYDAWDTHTKNFSILKENKLPHFDQTFTALLEDLTDRGLLDETLVVVMSEMGRTPRDQRQRRPRPLDVLLLGAVRRRRHQGRHGLRRLRRAGGLREGPPVSTADICATIYQCLGIDPDLMVPDRTSRPVSIDLGGRPIEGILA